MTQILQSPLKGDSRLHSNLPSRGITKSPIPEVRIKITQTRRTCSKEKHLRWTISRSHANSKTMPCGLKEIIHHTHRATRATARLTESRSRRPTSRIRSNTARPARMLRFNSKRNVALVIYFEALLMIIIISKGFWGFGGGLVDSHGAIARSIAASTNIN